MSEKTKIKKKILTEMTEQIDELFESEENIPKDLYELEQSVSQLGKDFERKAIEAIDEYNRKRSKKKLPDL